MPKKLSIQEMERNGRREPQWGIELPVLVTRADNSMGFTEEVCKVKDNDGKVLATVDCYLAGFDFIVKVGDKRYVFQMTDAIRTFLNNEKKLKAKKEPLRK